MIIKKTDERKGRERVRSEPRDGFFNSGKSDTKRRKKLSTDNEK